MGGDLTTLMCNSPPYFPHQKVTNIEGLQGRHVLVMYAGENTGVSVRVYVDVCVCKWIIQ